MPLKIQAWTRDHLQLFSKPRSMNFTIKLGKPVDYRGGEQSDLILVKSLFRK